MSTTNLPFLVPIAAMGMPLAQPSGQPVSGYDSVMNASNGHSDCEDWVLPYNSIQQLADALPSEAPVDNSTPYGDYYYKINVGGTELSMQSNTMMKEDVVDGSTVPSTYDQDGKSYNIVGSIEHTIAFDGVSAWSVTLPMMLLSSVPMTALGTVGYKAFLKPMISQIYKGVRSALTSTVEEGMDEVAITAAADAAAEVADVSELILEEAVVDATLSLETGGLALIGFVGLIAIQVGIMLIIHPSYHQLVIYNFTPYDLNWGDPELKHDAKITMEPVTDSTGTTPANCLPAMSNESPSPFIAPVNTASMAQFNVYSDSEVYGVKWGLSFSICQPGTNNEVMDPVGAMWDIPLGGKNSIGVSSGVSQHDLSDWVSDEEGDHKEHSRSKDLAQNIGVTNSIDHLQDKHKVQLGSDDDAYVYRSVLVFYEKS